MAKAKDLAGLAALGALGYMLAKGKGDKGEDSNPTRAARPESTEDRLESPEDTIKRSMAKAPEAEDADYGNEGRRTSMATAPKAPTAPRTSTTAKVGVKAAPKPTPKGSGRLDTGGNSPALAAMEARKAARDEDARIGNINAYNREIKGQNMENNIVRGMVEPQMKKGGKVKKMASGGMTASRRADGIASRGKTKCKMY
jgi:hypothetical protein